MEAVHIGLTCVMLLLLGFVVAVSLICVSNDCVKECAFLEDTNIISLICSLLFRKTSSCSINCRERGDCLERNDTKSVTDFSTTIKPGKQIKKNITFKECTSNNSCPPDNYCSEGSCIKCFDCSVVQRLPPSDKCAKGLLECGSYIDGFSEDAVTADTNYTICVTANFHKFQDTINTNAAVIAFIVGLSVFLFLLSIRIKKSRRMIKSDSESRILSSSLQETDVQETASNCHTLYYTMEQDDEAHRGTYSYTCPMPCSDSAQQQPSYLPLATDVLGLNVAQGHGTTDSAVPETNEANNVMILPVGDTLEHS